ncbi:MAG: acyl-CoA thioesterase [Phormidesmis sp. RL_2_1]|nr:acyl-CoA thioesterase [Phormidesmis sp. RL_2_1]
MSFVYHRVIRFHQTDAAGVVYFANLLTLCHEAYEASLAEAGIALSSFFSQANGLAVPIIHTAADFYRPLVCGDAIAITLTPVQLSPYSFEITYSIASDIPPGQTTEKKTTVDPQKPIATALTRHICIKTGESRRCPITPDLARWLALFGQATADG